MSQNQDPSKKKGTFSFNLQKAFVEDDDDQTSIQLSNDIVFKVNYFQLCKYSKLIRQNYDQNNLKEHLLQDIQKFQEEYGIKNENIVTFFKILQEENSDIQNDQYFDLYLLSKLYKVSSLEKMLKEYSENHMNDINFVISLICDEPRSSQIHDIFPKGEIFAQLEECLTNNIEQCIQNENFGKLPISTIYRIIEKSDKTKFTCDMLYEFISKSIDVRYSLFAFINVKNLSDSKFNELYDNYVKNKDSIYFKMLPFDLTYINELKKQRSYDFIKRKSKLGMIISKDKKEKSDLESRNEIQSGLLHHLLLHPDDFSNITISYDTYPLFYWACKIDDLELVKYLISNKKVDPSDIKISNFIYSDSFRVACKNGNLKLVKYLIELDKINFENEDVFFLLILITFFFFLFFNFVIISNYSRNL